MSMPIPAAPVAPRTSISQMCALALCMAMAAGGYGWPVLAEQATELVAHARQHHGARAGRAVEAWQQALSQAQGQAEPEQLRRINAFWNHSLRQADDRTIWNQADYWATPIESLAKGAGDCEDFVIGKYFSLLDLGVSPEKLRLIYVRANVGGTRIAHMVLGYYPNPGDEPLVLDSLLDDILPARKRADLTPVFSFNGQGIYAQGSRRAPVEHIGRWRGLLDRMNTEGYRRHP
ncbi:transglutaminase-like cysteine peptidase [Castellaniella sp.]|uniref:transglutaminase-like cysteine peptidase n=1 Tax=Castellaniella sp. TaxID=1955812 RepID=UPI00356067B1